MVAVWLKRPFLPLLLFALCLPVLATACAPTPPDATAVPTPTAIQTATAPAPPETVTPAQPSTQDTAAVAPLVAAASPANPTATPCATRGQIITGTYVSALAGESRYRIYLPPCYGLDGRAYPVLYMLPGNIHDDSIWDQLGLDEAAETLIQAGRIPPLLIVMADGGLLADNTSGGPGSYESLILDELIPFIDRQHCTWVAGAGRAIGGLSRGGYWALEIAFRHPEQFASVGGHSAALVDRYGGPDVNPEQTGLNRELGKLRVYFDVGEDDWYITNVRQLHEEMTALGIPHKWVLNEGGHDDAYWSAHVTDYLTWYAAAWPHARETYPECLPGG